MEPSFSLPAELTIYTVGELFPQCQVWMHADARSELPVQAQDVAEVDAAGVQLLLAWSRTLVAGQRCLQLVAPSAALVAACAALGVDGLVRPHHPATQQGCP